MPVNRSVASKAQSGTGDHRQMMGRSIPGTSKSASWIMEFGRRGGQYTTVQTIAPSSPTLCSMRRVEIWKLPQATLLSRTRLPIGLRAKTCVAWSGRPSQCRKDRIRMWKSSSCRSSEAESFGSSTEARAGSECCVGRMAAWVTNNNSGLARMARRHLARPGPSSGPRN